MRIDNAVKMLCDYGIGENRLNYLDIGNWKLHVLVNPITNSIVCIYSIYACVAFLDKPQNINTRI